MTFHPRRDVLECVVQDVGQGPAGWALSRSTPALRIGGRGGNEATPSKPERANLFCQLVSSRKETATASKAETFTPGVWSNGSALQLCCGGSGRVGIELWLPEADGPMDLEDPAHEALMVLLGSQSRREVVPALSRVLTAMRAQMSTRGWRTRSASYPRGVFSRR